MSNEANPELLYGLIFNVQSMTVHDGPGLRTEFFMKGCPLSCKWCSNPEGLKPYAEPGVYPDKCIGADVCGDCLKVCPASALMFTKEGNIAAIDRDRCKKCGACANACSAGAITMWGKRYSVDEVMRILRREKPYMKRSGGGVTFSGGEALLQADFIREVCKECRQEGIHTCVASCLHVPYSSVQKVLAYTDIFITDIKTMDTRVHKKYCGVGNELILNNIKKLVEDGADLVIRIPVINGINSSDENFIATGRFILDELKNKPLQLQLLPYRRLGTEKYSSLNMDYPFEDYVGSERKEWEQLILGASEMLRKMGIPAVAGATIKIDFRH